MGLKETRPWPAQQTMLSRLRSGALRVTRRGMAGGPDGRPQTGPNAHRPHVGGPYNIGHSQCACAPCPQPAQDRPPFYARLMFFCFSSAQEFGD